MKKKMLFKMGVLLFGLFILLFPILGCEDQQETPAQEEQPEEATPEEPEVGVEIEPITITFVTAQSGGTWYPLGVAISSILQSEIPGMTVSVEPGGGMSNVIAVNEGQAELGLTMSVSAYDGLVGNPPFEGPQENIRNVVTMYPQYAQYVTLKDSDIRNIEDLKGKRVNFYPKGWTSEVVATQVLELHGMTHNDVNAQFLSTAEATNLMRDGHLDATLEVGTLGQASWLELATVRGIDLIEFDQDIVNQLIEVNPGFSHATIPAGTYEGVDDDTNSFASQLHIVTNSNVPEEVIYLITKTLIENMDDLASVAAQIGQMAPSDLAVYVGIENHAGAQRYFDEQGW